MRSSKLVLAGVALSGALLAVAPTQAAVSVIGTGFARLCYEYADGDRASDQGLQNCDRALTEEALTVRDRSATHVNRGILYMHAKDLPRALADYEKALTLKPNLAEAYVNKGIALVHLGGRDSEAVEAITKGISLNTARPEIAYYTRGVANELLGNTRAAYEDYQQAATLKPDWNEPKAQLSRFTVIKKAG